MPTKKVEVWDIWVRIGHWAMVIAVILQFITGGDLSWQQAHATVGLLVLGWVVFRILWGFGGAGSARFRAFIPTTINALQISLAALRGGPPERPATHTALGGIGALILLLLLGLIALTGAASSDDIFFEGPLARYLSNDWVTLATSAHHRLTDLLLVLIGLHLAAIAWHQWRLKEPLIQGMWHGKKLADQGPLWPPSTGPRIWLRGFALLLVCLLATWLILGTTSL